MNRLRLPTLRILIALAACGMTTALAATHADAAVILTHWSFDTDFTDDSGNSNHLTAASGTPNITTTSGEHKFGGGALNLVNSASIPPAPQAPAEYLSLTTGLSMTTTDEWSVAFWGRRVETDNRQGMVIGDAGSLNSYIWTPNNASRMHLRSKAGDDAEFPATADEGAFHHWAVSYDGDGMVTAWRDGVVLDTSEFDGSIDLFHVGNATSGTTTRFAYNGQIDEVYIFSGTLTTDDVVSLRDNNALDGDGGDDGGNGEDVPSPAALPAGLAMLIAIVGRRRSGRSPR